MPQNPSILEAENDKIDILTKSLGEFDSKNKAIKKKLRVLLDKERH